jgi:hypothetical protein
MKTKLTKRETRAAALCESIRRNDGGSVTVEWVNSRTWGSNPRILHHGEPVTDVSGCGYCKHSTALADALRFLPETEEGQAKVHRTGGAGVSSVIAALAAQGWTLAPVASGKGFDAYTLARIPVKRTNGARSKCPSCKAKPGAEHSTACTGGNHKLC